MTISAAISATKLTLATLPIGPSCSGITRIEIFRSLPGSTVPSFQNSRFSSISARGMVPVSREPRGIRSSTTT